MSKPMFNEFDIVIVGGGASGLMAACAASDAGADVALLERNDRVGKKLAVTGNGRCNISNKEINPERYHGDTDFAFGVFSNVSRETIEKYFNSMGIIYRDDGDNRLYPMSFQATAVVDALRFACDKKGVKTFCKCKCESIVKNSSEFETVCNIDGKNTVFKSKKVIVCAGGKSYPKSGSDGFGEKLLKSFGHTATETKPAIVQLKTEKDFIKSLKGIKLDVVLKGDIGSKRKEEFGELLFTDYGISGPAVLQFGRFAGSLKENAVFVDLIPEMDEKMLFDELISRREKLGFLPAKSLFLGILQSRLGETLIKYVIKDALKINVSDLNGKQIADICKNAKNLKLKVTGNTGFENAQVTAGGINTFEFEAKTMQSKKVKGLYAAGEVLDVDGDCGGFNLQWAWSSGYLSGISAANNNGENR